MNTNVAAPDRLLRTAPLILRWSMAAILIVGGYHQASSMFSPESQQSVAADAAGVAVSANWSSIMGAGQMLVGGLLAVGFLTRVTSLAVLGGVGYAAYSSATAVPDQALHFAAQAFQAHQGSMLLLAAACASLLVSGAGRLGIDCRKRRRAELEAAGLT